MDNLYLCFKTLETKGLILRFPLSIMNDELKAHLEMFPDSDADAEMLHRLQERVIQAILRIANEEKLLRVYPRNNYVITSNGIETENNNTWNYIPICDATMYNTQVQIYLTPELDSFESGMEMVQAEEVEQAIRANVAANLEDLQKEGVVFSEAAQALIDHMKQDKIKANMTETEKEAALDLYMRRILPYHLERGTCM